MTRYVVTYAQNATPVHAPFLRALEGYCAHNDARLVVIPGRYKNPTSIHTSKMADDEWWSGELVRYIVLDPIALGNLVIRTDISIQPTASRPLNGLEILTAGHSAIVGHTKIEFKTVPSARREYPRILTSTGAVTVANYTKTKAGKRGEAHHTLGATVVELDGDQFHLRQIIADEDGSFYDLSTHYTASGGVDSNCRPLALVCGDIHVAKTDPVVMAATLTAEDSILHTLKPERVVLHDVLDFDARNHHRRDSLRDRYLRTRGVGLDSVEQEVDLAIAFVDSFPKWTRPHVVQSNHDEAFDRWLEETHPRHDPVNARFWCECWAQMLAEGEVRGEYPSAFEMLYRRRGSGAADFVGRNEGLRIGEIECGFHGDKGANGSRGSINQFARFGFKSVIGHSHSPGIRDGCYQVGVTGLLDQGYNATPSGWLQTHALIYPSSKRTLLNVISGRWRG